MSSCVLFVRPYKITVKRQSGSILLWDGLYGITVELSSFPEESMDTKWLEFILLGKTIIIQDSGFFSWMQMYVPRIVDDSSPLCMDERLTFDRFLS